jgi:hypothetical protein
MMTWFRSHRGPRHRGRAFPAIVILWGVLIIVVLLETAAPSSAGIMKTKRKRPSARGTYRELLLVIGSGFEFTTDSEESEYDFPFLVEYGFTRNLKLSAEPDWAYIHFKDGSKPVSGFGDLETTLTFEFIGERRKRPAIATEGIVKWPTATSELGTGKADYSIGAVVSKDLVKVELDFNAVYTFAGSPPGIQMKNTGEASIAAEWHLNSVLDLEGEIATNTGSGGGFHGRPGSIGGIGGSIRAAEPSGAETEGTLGLAELLNPCLKLEEGVILNSDGSWQIVTAWEWDFGEGE